MEEEEVQEGAATALRVYVWPLEIVSFFKFRGRLLTGADDDWPAVISNLKIPEIAGLNWIRSWGGRAWTLGCWVIYASPSSKPFFCLSQRHGF